MNNRTIATADGFEAARAESRAFAADLLAEAGRIAARSDSEQASAEHVRRAAAHLYQGSGGRRKQALNTSGGILVGLGGGGLVGFLQQTNPHPWYVGVAAAVTVVGAILATAGLARG